MSEQAITILVAVVFLLLSWGFSLFMMVVGWFYISWQKGAGKKDDQLERNSARQSQDTVDELKEFERRMRIIERMTDRLGSQMELQATPLFARVQQEFSEKLHHPHAEDKRTDNLIDKLENLTLTPNETIELKGLFVTRSLDMSPGISEDERKIATIMPIFMDLVLKEADDVSSGTSVEIVSTTKVEEKE